MTNESKKYPLRVAKFIAQSGIASRRQAEKMIIEKRVKVDGKIIESAALNIEEDSKVKVDGKEIVKQNKLYVMDQIVYVTSYKFTICNIIIYILLYAHAIIVFI
mgnify:CR=1 FL=1